MRHLTLSAALLLLPAVSASARPVASAREARAIAEHETSGIAVSARRVHLNGASGGWEVDLRMPGEKQGWRVVVDCDSKSVFRRTRIPNPVEVRGKRWR